MQTYYPLLFAQKHERAKRGKYGLSLPFLSTFCTAVTISTSHRWSLEQTGRYESFAFQFKIWSPTFYSGQTKLGGRRVKETKRVFIYCNTVNYLLVHCNFPHRFIIWENRPCICHHLLKHSPPSQSLSCSSSLLCNIIFTHLISGATMWCMLCSWADTLLSLSLFLCSIDPWAVELLMHVQEKRATCLTLLLSLIWRTSSSHPMSVLYLPNPRYRLRVITGEIFEVVLLT